MRMTKASPQGTNRKTAAIVGVLFIIGTVSGIMAGAFTAPIQAGSTYPLNVDASETQLGKYYGAKVTGVCSTANLGWIKFLGADHVIDYTREDFTENSRTYDIIFDTVGKRSFSGCKGSLTDKGIYLTTVPTPVIMFQAL